MKITLAQLKSFIGDIIGNAEKIIITLSQTKHVIPDLILFPEISHIGYPPRDLLEK